MRLNLAVFFCLLLAFNLMAAEDQEIDRVPLKGWPVSFDEVVRKASASGGLRAVADALPSAATHFIAVTPCRLVDTRNANDVSFGAPMFQPGETRHYNLHDASVAAGCGVPVASAYSLNFTIVNYSGRGNLKAYPSGTTAPGISTLNYGSGPPVGNAAIVPADVNGSIDVAIALTVQPGPTNVVIDVNGYFAEGVVTKVTAGSGLAGNATTGDVTLSVAPLSITAAQLAPDAVTNGAIQDATISGAKIANDEVVRSIKGLKDSVDLVGTGGATVSTTPGTISINVPVQVPSGTMVVGPLNDTTIIGAGFSPYADTANLWRRTSTVGTPVARSGHTAVWTGTTMIVWGGFSGVDTSGVEYYENTGGLYDPATDSWTPVKTDGAPSARVDHSAVWTGMFMIVWGGRGSGGYLTDGAKYLLSEHSWTGIAAGGSARRLPTAVWTGDDMIIWGGLDESGTGTALDTGWKYNLRSDRWGATSGMSAPSPRTGHTAVWTGKRMLIWGGEGVATPPLNTGASYEPVEDFWTPMTVAGAPAGRVGHTAVWTGSSMIVWGAYPPSTGSPPGTGGIYDPTADTWTPTAIGGAPPSIESHTAVWTGSRMIVWGGQNTGGSSAPPVDTGGVYDPATDSWIATSTSGGPGARVRHTAVWTGTTMIIWGGTTNRPGNSSLLNTGSQATLLSYYRKN